MVRLICMPFGSITYPSLALGILKAVLARAGVRVGVSHLNFDLAGIVGTGPYHALSLANVQLGEWLFAPAAWGGAMPRISCADFFALYGLDLPDDGRGPWLENLREVVVPAFLDRSAKRLLAESDFRVAGFSCTYFQTNASLALGRILKERRPKIRLVYGGAGFHGVMGEEIMEKAPFVDAVSTCEADDTAAPLFGALEKGEPVPPLPGVLARNRAGRVVPGKPPAVLDEAALGAVPVPDFSEFFQAAGAFGLLNEPGWIEKAVIPFESSRGCWWGEKNQCAFCGLNGRAMDYRKKPAARVLETLADHGEKYPVASFFATDNNLARDAFDDLVPTLARNPPVKNAQFFYSVKSNLTRDQIQALADARVLTLGPGIESLSSHLLRLMKKGVDALQNIRFLKSCREFSIHPRWNNLVRVPGETRDDYRLMEERIPSLVHLPPPYGSGKIQCLRFSPYFETPGKWTDNIRPEPWYKALFPESVDLFRAAYGFAADWKDVLDESVYQGTLDAVSRWRSLWTGRGEPPRLTGRPRRDGLVIEDTRFGAQKTHRLTPEETAALSSLDAPVSLEKAEAAAKKQNPGLTPRKFRESLDSLLTLKLAVTEDNRAVSLVVPARS